MVVGCVECIAATISRPIVTFFFNLFTRYVNIMYLTLTVLPLFRWPLHVSSLDLAVFCVSYAKARVICIHVYMNTALFVILATVWCVLSYFTAC